MTVPLLIGAGNESFFPALKECGFDPIILAPLPLVKDAVRFHADCSCFFDGRHTLVLPPSQSSAADIAVSYGADVIISEEPSSPYPGDSVLNARAFGDRLICNPGSVSVMIRDLYPYRNLIPVKQGYSACSCICIGQNSVALITDDASVDQACESNGIDRLYVSKGEFSLPGYDYGFFGGSCFYYDCCLYFLGDASVLSFYNELVCFCARYGTDVVSLSDSKPFDFGGAVPLIIGR